MFTKLVEYDFILDKIATKTHLTEEKINTLIRLIIENPNISANTLFDISISLDKGEKFIFDGGQVFSLEPMLMESSTVNLMEITIPLITKHIPQEIIKYLTEKHARSIVESILNVEFNPENDTVLDLRNRIDEMFDAGDISIPVQGLRKDPNSVEVVMNGVFAPMLYKGIQFGPQFHKKPIESHCKNKSTLKQVIKDYTFVKSETPLMLLLPKFIITMKNLLGNE